MEDRSEIERTTLEKEMKNVKTMMTFSIDYEVALQLKHEKKKSALISKLLREHYSLLQYDSEEKIKDKLQQLDIELSRSADELRMMESRKKRLQETLEQLKKKKKEHQELFAQIPQVILNDFRDMPRMSEQTLKQRYVDVYRNKIKGRMPDLGLVLKAFYAYKEGEYE
jgi:hypothetical protein